METYDFASVVFKTMFGHSKKYIAHAHWLATAFKTMFGQSDSAVTACCLYAVLLINHFKNNFSLNSLQYVAHAHWRFDMERNPYKFF